MLGQHPEMYSLPETQLLVRETMSEWWRDFGYNIHSHGLTRAVAEIYFGRQTPANIRRARRWLWSRRGRLTSQVLEEIACELQPLRLVEKTPMLTYLPGHMRRALAAFPDAKFLHLLRHPSAYAKSLIEFFRIRGPRARSRQNMLLFRDRESIFFGIARSTARVGGRLSMRAEYAWYLRHSDVLAFTSQLPAGQVMQIRAEDLLAFPDRELRRIAGWLVIRHDPRAIDEMKHPERWPFASIGPYNAPFGADPKFLENPVLRLRPAFREPFQADVPVERAAELEPAVAGLARQLGYSLT